MKVIDNGSIPLTNAEVLAHIHILQSDHEKAAPKRKDKDNQPQNLHRVIQDVQTYSQMSSLPFKRVVFSPEAIHEVTTTLKSSPWKLLPAEILQLLNHVPNTASDMKYFLEDADLRFKEEELGQMVDIIHGALKVAM